AAAADCPIEIDPPTVVVKYGDPVTVHCTATQRTREMGWEVPNGSRSLLRGSQSLLWSFSNLTDWTAEPRCYAKFDTEPKQCYKKLSILHYKYPDNVSISIVNQTAEMEEGGQYLLQCDVKSIAPVKYLSVNWYRGGLLINTETFSENTTKPVDVSPTLLITSSCTDGGLKFSCAAELKLGQEGPQPNPVMKSESLHITELYCPIVIDPPTVVVRYGDPVTVHCTATRTTRGMGWEASVGSIDMQIGVQSALWSVSSLTDWTAEPKCFSNFDTEPKQCEKKPSILLYKYPDSVSIRYVRNTGPMEEGRPYWLLCEVKSIAPVQYLSVNWYRGGALIHNDTFANFTTRTPVDVPRTLLITPSCTNDGAQYSCEAELKLGQGGPNPVMKSEPLRATVLFCPIVIDPPAVVVKYGDPVSVNCTATRTTRGMGWEASVGSTGIKTGPQSLLWGVSNLTDWTVEPTCFSNFDTDPKQCGKKLNISLYTAAAFCPIVIDPPAVVVKYGDPVAANCTVTRTTRGMGWEASVGSIDMQTDFQSLLWSASSLTDWTAEPKCYANFKTEPKQCEKKLSILLYKYPDSVSISSVGHTGPMEEGGQYQLQCDVQSIAPVQYLSVNWYRRGALIHTENISEDTTRTPVNVSRTLLITPSCTDDGVQYTCEAELRLGPEGPQANPVKKSEPLSVTVHCESHRHACLAHWCY
ncbi:VCAM1 protein, partial [Amia calva]|nr:VCAM1 protein [Amia calva]